MVGSFFFLRSGLGDLLKYIDKRDCAQEKELVKDLVEMIQRERRRIGIRNL